MKNLKKEYQLAFKEIDMLEENKNKIFYNILEVEKRQKKIYRIAVKSFIVLFVAIICIGVARAKDIYLAIKKFTIVHSTNNGSIMGHTDALLEVNYDKENYPLENNKDYSTEYITNSLNIKILRNKFFSKDSYKVLNIKEYENDIQNATFDLNNCIDFNSSIGFAHFSFSFASSLTNENTESSYDFYISSAQNEIHYFIKSLNIEATIFDLISDENPIDYKVAFFIYENVIYKFEIMKKDMTLNYLYEILESFS